MCIQQNTRFAEISVNTTVNALKHIEPYLATPKSRNSNIAIFILGTIREEDAGSVLSPMLSLAAALRGAGQGQAYKPEGQGTLPIPRGLGAVIRAYWRARCIYFVWAAAVERSWKIKVFIEESLHTWYSFALQTEGSIY